METWNTGYNPLNTYGRQNNYMQNSYMPPAPKYEIIRVNGEAGAKNFRMAPNSNALLLDDTAAIVWLAQSDGTGYMTVTPYDITPHQQVMQVTLNDLATRVTQLEEYINNAKPNSFSNKQSKKQRQRSNESSSDSTNQGADESN